MDTFEKLLNDVANYASTEANTIIKNFMNNSLPTSDLSHHAGKLNAMNAILGLIQEGFKAYSAPQSSNTSPAPTTQTVSVGEDA